MSPRDISSRWDNTPMRDYSTWNLKIVPFVFSWYKRGGNEAVIFVPATPNSQLQKYQMEIKRQGFKIKVVKKAGVPIRRLLQKSDPFKPRQCEREDCQVCWTEGKGPCNRESVTYEIKCIGCNNVYIRRRNVKERVY